MKKGIRCNETQYTAGKNRNQIRYEFVTDDGITPSSCTVRLGDMDPLSGKQLTDLTFFREYHAMVDREIYRNLNAVRERPSAERRAWREAELKRYIVEFKAEHGYAPSGDDLRFHLKQLEKERSVLSLDAMVNDEGESDMDRNMAFSVPFVSDLDNEIPLRMQALLDVAASLSGRKRDVLEAMIQEAAGGSARMRYVDVADKWDVKKARISQDKNCIKEMVRKRAAELLAEEEEE